MALSWLWTSMVVLSVFFAFTTGRTDSLGNAALEGAAAAVELCLSMAGVMCLWTGVMELMKQCGISEGLSRLFCPLLRHLFPEASRDSETLQAISANVSANMLGLGNAATPPGIRAVRRLKRGDRATNELCRFIVLNTASIQLIPSNVAALRASLGSAAPFDILPAVWVTSFCSAGIGLVSAWLLGKATGHG